MRLVFSRIYSLFQQKNSQKTAAARKKNADTAKTSLKFGEIIQNPK